MMAGETCADESNHGLDRLRVDMFYRTLDEISQQLEDRFSDENLLLLKQMSHFASGKLLSENNICGSDIEDLCCFYHLNSTEIADELRHFRIAYKECHELFQSNEVSGRCCSTDEADHDEEYSTHEEKIEWRHNNFIIPLRLLSEISNYPHLKTLYKILVSIPATSCSAERAFSRLRIIKNRLRSSMEDAWMSSLMIMASEKDILLKISNDKLIEKFALCSIKLSKSLLFQ
jgi:hypothetical protein